MSLENRVALVTGAGRHIGEAIARELARNGAAVVLTARTLADVQRVEADIVSSGGRAFAVAGDATVEADVRRTIDAATEKLGPIDVLVNNVGVNKLGRLEQTSPEAWWSIVTGNLAGTYLYCRALAPQMVQRRFGRIINIGSRASVEGQMFSTPYCTAKHALVGFSRALALEVAAAQVTVNVVAPGMVGISDAYWSSLSELTGQSAAELKQTAIRRMPQQRELKPRDVAEAVAFFASEAAGRITGQCLNVSGGAVMR